jgi:E3 ubiquitin-protein ligase HECTD1
MCCCSSGSPEAGSDNSDTRAEFLEKLQRARAAVPTGTPLYTILSVERASNTITVGNWLLTSVEENELTVTNREGSAQKMTIREDLPGFVFESNRQTRHSFTAESTLGIGLN